jgi:hypothetical protein
MKAPRRSADSPHDERDGADSVERFAAKHAISRSQAYLEIAAGRLIARKVGSRTIITREDAATWRRALPKMSAGDEAKPERLRPERTSRRPGRPRKLLPTDDSPGAT